MTDRIADAIGCCQQMDSELAGETNAHGKQVKWAVGERLSSHLCSIYVTNLLQISSSVALKSWNTSEILRQTPNNTIKPLLIIQLHCLSTQSSHET